MKHEVLAEGIETTIYALYDDDALPRYIGRTKNSLSKRMIFHRNHANQARLPVHRWLLKHDKKVRAETIEIVQGSGADRESFWIRHYHRLGARLLNLTGGGELGNLLPFSAEHRRKISEAHRRGSFFACEQCNARFWRKPYAIAKGDCRFCSKYCYQESQRGVSKPISPAFTERGVAAAAARRRNQTNCKRGHPLNGNNLFYTSAGARGCKECRKIHKKTYRSKLQ